MSETFTTPLNTNAQRDLARRAVHRAPQGYVAVIKPETRTDKQNRLLWALIGDTQAQNEEMAQFDKDDAKLRFMQALGSEMRMLPELDGAGFFPVGQRSSKLNKKQFSDLVEVVLAWGANNGIVWSAKSHAAAAEHDIELRS